MRGDPLRLSLTHICCSNTSYYPIKMISRLSEKPCKAKGKKMLRVYTKEHTSTPPVSGCFKQAAGARCSPGDEGPE